MPAYNAAAHIENTVRRVPPEAWDRTVSLWIINDGSNDGTRETAERLAAEDPNIRAHHFGHNMGYGTVAKKGLALCHGDGAEIAVCLHADGQYPPEEIPRFVDTIEREGFDLLQGSRIASGTALSGGMPLYKYAGNRMLTFLENRVLGMRLSDFHSGYLFYGRRALERIAFERLSRSFDFDLEVIASARALGLKVGELPVPTRYGTEISHVRSIPYGMRCLGVMARYLVGTYRVAARNRYGAGRLGPSRA
jgi:glycosyltransferase involved in cell wall biosynthesis